MRRILRWPVPVQGTTLTMPSGSVVVHFDWQAARGEFSVWAVANDAEPDVQRRFAIVSTGMPMPDFSRHVGTCVMPDGFHVFHCVEVT